jgi:hypothetical protein
MSPSDTHTHTPTVDPTLRSLVPSMSVSGSSASASAVPSVAVPSVDVRVPLHPPESTWCAKDEAGVRLLNVRLPGSSASSKGLRVLSHPDGRRCVVAEDVRQKCLHLSGDSRSVCGRWKFWTTFKCPSERALVVHRALRQLRHGHSLTVLTAAGLRRFLSNPPGSLLDGVSTVRSLSWLSTSLLPLLAPGSVLSGVSPWFHPTSELIALSSSSESETDDGAASDDGVVAGVHAGRGLKRAHSSLSAGVTEDECLGVPESKISRLVAVPAAVSASASASPAAAAAAASPAAAAAASSGGVVRAAIVVKASAVPSPSSSSGVVAVAVAPTAEALEAEISARRRELQSIDEARDRLQAHLSASEKALQKTHHASVVNAWQSALASASSSVSAVSHRSADFSAACQQFLVAAQRWPAKQVLARSGSGPARVGGLVLPANVDREMLFRQNGKHPPRADDGAEWQIYQAAQPKPGSIRYAIGVSVAGSTRQLLVRWEDVDGDVWEEEPISPFFESKDSFVSSHSRTVPVPVPVSRTSAFWHSMFHFGGSIAAAAEHLLRRAPPRLV